MKPIFKQIFKNIKTFVSYFLNIIKKIVILLQNITKYYKNIYIYDNEI